jgi:hypothetical protein
MPRTTRPTLLLAAILLATPLFQAVAEEEPLMHDLGTRHRFSQPAGSPYLPVGCKDHRTLMFVVRGIESDDPAGARLLAERDCRPVAPGDYIRCGPGGWAYPSNGERMPYASYCRIGASDLPFYVLDVQMPLSEDR